MLRFSERVCGVGSLQSLGAWQMLNKSYHVSYSSISQRVWLDKSLYFIYSDLYPLVQCSWSSDCSFWWEAAERLFSVSCLRMDTIFTLLYDISGEQRIWIWIWDGHRNNPQIDQIHVWQQRKWRHQFFSLGRESYSTVGKWEITFFPL